MCRLAFERRARVTRIVLALGALYWLAGSEPAGSVDGKAWKGSGPERAGGIPEACGHAWEDVYAGGLIDAAAVAAEWMERGRGRWLEDERDAQQDEAVSFDFPAFVMNLRHRRDRREHSQALLRALGFSNIIFPETFAAAEVDFGAIIAQGWMTEASLRGLDERVHLRPPKAKRAYVANTIGHLSALRRGLESSSEVFAIFEDDLLPAAPLAELKRRLKHMLRVLTSITDTGNPRADMLYLEYCYEKCVNVSRVDDLIGWAKAPVCTGGIIYTRAGASRVLELCLPISDGIDGMLPALIEQGRLKALAATPPLLYQDGFFGTDAGRIHNAPNATGYMTMSHKSWETAPPLPRHFVYLPPCVELNAGNWSLIQSAVRETGDEEYLDVVSVIRGYEDEAFVDAADNTRRIVLAEGAKHLLLRSTLVRGGSLRSP